MTDFPSNHPADDALRALSLGQLSESDLACIATHLDGCAACCRRLDQLAAGDRFLARLQESASRPESAMVSPAERRPAVRALRQSEEGNSSTR